MPFFKRMTPVDSKASPTSRIKSNLSMGLFKQETPCAAMPQPNVKPRTLCRLLTTNLRAPFVNPGFDGVADGASFFQFFIVRPLERRGVGKAPMQPLDRAGENWAAFRACFIADGDDTGKRPSG